MGYLLGTLCVDLQQGLGCVSEYGIGIVEGENTDLLLLLAGFTLVQILGIAFLT